VEGPLALCNCIEKFLPHLFLQENKETFVDQKLFQKKKDQNKQSIAKKSNARKIAVRNSALTTHFFYYQLTQKNKEP